jgi:hypothetical protein
MTTVKCLVEGTFLVRDEGEPIPFGQTESSHSVVVHRYRFGWVCDFCEFRSGSTLSECKHIKAAKKENNNA